MGTLAYDPDRLRAVVSALGAAHDHLAAISSSDPLANGSVWKAHSAAEGLAGWRERIGSLLALDPLGTYAPVTIVATDITTALNHMLETLYGWQNATDPTGTAWDVPPAMEGAAVGWLLSNSPTFDLLGGGDDPDKEAVFVAVLQRVVADPEALATLRTYLSEEGIAELAEALAQHRTDIVNRAGGDGVLGEPISEDVQERLEVVDQGFAALAAAIVDPDEPLESAQRALDGVRPYAAAHVVANMQADDDVIAQLALDTLGRYSDSWNDPDTEPLTWERPGAHYVGIGDLLFPKITSGNVLTANAFVVQVLAFDPSMLTNTIADPRSTANLVLHATDSSIVTPELAGNVIRPYLEYLREPPLSPQLPGSPVTAANPSALHATVGALIAPWLPQFTYRAWEDWRWSNEQADEMFEWVIDDVAAFDDLFELHEHWADTLPIDTSGDPQAVLENIENAAQLIGALLDDLGDRFVQRAISDRAAWDFIVGIIPQATGWTLKIMRVDGLPKKIIVKAVKVGVDLAARAAEERGLLGAPPPIEVVIYDTEHAAQHMLATGTHLAAVAMIDAYVASGVLPPDVPRPRTPDPDSPCPEADYRRYIDEWLDEHVDDDDARNGIENAVKSFTSDAQSEEACDDLRDLPG